MANKRVTALTEKSTLIGEEYVLLDGETDGTYKMSVENLLKNVKSNNYSTQEEEVGTWINGKPLYKQTIVNTATMFPNTDNNFAFFTNKTIVKVEGFGILGDQIRLLPLLPTRSSPGWYAHFNVNDTNSSNALVFSSYGIDINWNSVTATVFYTKNTN